MRSLYCRLAIASLLLFSLSSCIQLYINDDGYRMYGIYDKQYGRYPPYEAVHSSPDSNVFAYELEAADLLTRNSTCRYRWIIPHGNVCVVYPRSLDLWAPFMDSARQAHQVEVKVVVSNYDRKLIREYRSWLNNQGWNEPIFILSNARYGNKRNRKLKRFIQELEGPAAKTPYAPVRHILLDSEGRCIYTAREDEDPTNKGAKPRATIEAEIRQLLAQP